MNRRDFLATTPFALVPRPPRRASTGTKDSLGDPPWLKDLLPDGESLSSDWIQGAPESPTVGRRDDEQLTVRGIRPRQHPQKEESLSPRYAERHFVTDSNLPPEFEHLDVALEVAGVGEHTEHNSRSCAVQALHEVTVAEETENWDLMSTGWVDVDVALADDPLRQRSVASLRKPQCAVPNDIELSTNKPIIEMAVAVAPLSWGTVVVTGTVVNAEETNQLRQLVNRLASHTVDTASSRPTPKEARR